MSWDKTYTEEKVKVQVRQPSSANQPSTDTPTARELRQQKSLLTVTVEEGWQGSSSAEYCCSCQSKSGLWSQSLSSSAFTYCCVTWKNYYISLVGIMTVSIYRILIMGRHCAKCFSTDELNPYFHHMQDVVYLKGLFWVLHDIIHVKSIVKSP